MQKFARLIDQTGELLAGPVDTVEGHKRRLAGLLVLASGLAQRRCIGGHVEKVIGKLERKPDRRAEFGERFLLLRRTAADDGACLAGKTDQRAGLHRLQGDNAGLVRLDLFGGKIERLTTGHATKTCSTRQSAHQTDADFGRQLGCLIGDDVESQGQQAVAGKNSGGFVKGAVDRRLTATQIIVVHRRQIVVDQRIAMDAFERCRNAQGRFVVRTEESGAFQDQERANTLAAIQDPVTDRSQEVWRSRYLTIGKVGTQQAVKHVFHRLGADGEGDFEVDVGDLCHVRSDEAKTALGQVVTRRCADASASVFQNGGKRDAALDHGIEIEPRMAPRRQRKKKRGRFSSWLRRIVLALVLVALVPVALVLLYLPSVVHPISTLMAKDLVTLSGYDRRWVALDDISPRLVHAVMMSEDGQFCSHRGIDLGEMRAVVNDFLAGEAARGGSTITMQTAKNLFLWHGRSYIRKAVELPYAVYMDMVMPKRRIMEIYLNIAEWGPGIYGAEAAAQHHFGKPSRDLTARQAALLAVTLPNPYTRNPAKPGPGLNRLASTIDRRAGHAGGYNHCLKP